MMKTSEESMIEDTATVIGPEDTAAMAESKPFTFDRSFDLVEELPEEVAEEEEPEEIVPTFSEAEMQAARDESFAAGKQEGVNEAAEATEREIVSSLSKINEQFGSLFQANEDAGASILDSAISVAIGVARKAFPALNDRSGLGEIERVVSMAMEKILDEPRVTIFINPEIEAPLNERIAPMAAQTGFKGDIDIIATDDIAAGDCRVEWNSGGAKRDMNLLWQEIDEIVERNLSENSNEPAQPEPEQPVGNTEELIEVTPDVTPEEGVDAAPIQDTPQPAASDEPSTETDQNIT